MVPTTLPTETQDAPIPEIPEVLVALTPEALPKAQADLRNWCRAQIRALTGELRELEEHRLIAQANGWKLQGVANQLRRAKQRLQYYDKIAQAIDAGYLVVPNMPIDILAVRVGKDAPARAEQTAEWGNPQSFETRGQILPAGEGTYVDDRVRALDESRQIPDGKGGDQEGDPLRIGRGVRPSRLSRTLGQAGGAGRDAARHGTQGLR